MITFASLSDIDELVFIEEKMFDTKSYFQLTKIEFQRLLNKKSTILHVAKEEERVVGYSLGIIINKQHIWFNSLAVLKEWQMSGVAKELFEAIEQFALANNLQKIILEIREDNRALFRRYKNMGYCEWKRIEKYYPDGCSAIRMIKTVS